MHFIHNILILLFIVGDISGMTLVKEFAYYIKLPFVNLTRRAKIILFFRLSLSVLLILVSSLLLGGSATNNSMYLLKLDCEHENLANGLLTALRETFSQKTSFLTTAEIKILAQYIEGQIKNTPEFIFSNMRNWCYESYENEEFNYIINSDSYYDYTPGSEDRSNVTIVCSGPSSNYVFDYRMELSTIGLNVILAYAYTADFGLQSGLTDQIMYVPDEEYVRKLDSRRQANISAVGLLATGFALQAIIFFATFIYYSNRGLQKDDAKIPLITKNLFAVLSLFSLMAIFSSFMIFVTLIRLFKTEIHKELDSFGLKIHAGGAFLGLFCFEVALAFISFGLWGGPIWCNRSQRSSKSPAELDDTTLSYDDDIYDNYYEDHAENSKIDSSDESGSLLNPFEGENKLSMATETSILRQANNSPKKQSHNPLLKFKRKPPVLSAEDHELTPMSPILMDHILNISASSPKGAT